MQNFPIDDGFLINVINAAFEATAYDRRRMTAIGSGELVLAHRLIMRKELGGSVYVHEWMRSDPDDFHDHPWDFVSLILSVGYWEVVPSMGCSVRTWRKPGEIIFRKSTDRHRVELETDSEFVEHTRGARPVSLVMTGPEIREWGFWVDGAFVAGREYRDRQTHDQPA